jgi:hypothetical protein
MKSTVFSVLKIVVVAMMLVWALLPAPVQAQDCTAFGQCMSVCGNAMSQCANGCGRVVPVMQCINQCVAVFNSCTGQCRSQYPGCN